MPRDAAVVVNVAEAYLMASLRLRAQCGLPHLRPWAPQPPPAREEEAVAPSAAEAHWLQARGGALHPAAQAQTRAGTRRLVRLAVGQARARPEAAGKLLARAGKADWPRRWKERKLEDQLRLRPNCRRLMQIQTGLAGLLPLAQTIMAVSAPITLPQRATSRSQHGRRPRRRLPDRRGLQHWTIGAALA